MTGLHAISRALPGRLQKSLSHELLLIGHVLADAQSLLSLTRPLLVGQRGESGPLIPRVDALIGPPGTSPDDPHSDQPQMFA
jgi:hypothetical protein